MAYFPRHGLRRVLDEELFAIEKLITNLFRVGIDLKAINVFCG